MAYSRIKLNGAVVTVNRENFENIISNVTPDFVSGRTTDSTETLGGGAKWKLQHADADNLFVEFSVNRFRTENSKGDNWNSGVLVVTGAFEFVFVDAALEKRYVKALTNLLNKGEWKYDR